MAFEVNTDRVQRTPVRPNVIGLLGADGAGKSTVARMIANYLNPIVDDVEMAAYAADLKLMFRQLDPIIGTRIIGEEAVAVRWSELNEEGYTEAMIKEAYPEYRRVLRALGTDCLRSRHDLFWVKQLSRHFKGRHPKRVMIIDDVRFKNEASAIVNDSNWGRGAVLKIVGRGTDIGPGEEINDAHFDALIDNTGTTESTREQVEEVLAQWGWNR